MTFNELKVYHLKNIRILLKSGKEIKGLITSHHWREDNTEVIALSILGPWTIERVECSGIKEIRVLGE